MKLLFPRGALGIMTTMLAGATAAACGSNVPTTPATWACPPDWVPTQRGGCGPAVMLCAPDGGGAADACANVDLATAREVTDTDGVTGHTFRRLADGGIGGGWHEPGDPDGPPSQDWTPDGGISSCPATWSRTATDECDPHLDTTCPTGSAPTPGGMCLPTAASDCPVGEYADVAAEAAGAPVVHVRAGADSTMADGSAAHPYASLAAAMTVASGGTWILVAAGDYRESVSVRSDIHIVGVCADSVHIASTNPSNPTLQSYGSSARLDARGLTIGGAFFGVDAENRAQLELSRSRIEQATGAGAMISMGSHVTLRDVRITGTRSFSDGTAGRGVNAQEAAQVTLERVSLEANVDDGIFAIDANTIVHITDSVIRATRTRRTNAITGHGIEGVDGARIDATRTVLDGNQSTGMFLTNATAMLTDCIVRGTRSLDDGTGGAGIYIDGGSLTATRVLVAENLESGVALLDAPADATIQESVIRDTQPRGDGTLGRGIQCGLGAHAHLQNVVLRSNSDVGAFATDDPTLLELDEVVIQATRELSDGGGYAALANSGGHVRASHVLATGNHSLGFGSAGEGTHVDVSDSVIRDTMPTQSGQFGRGLEVLAGATAIATRVTLAHNQDISVFVSGAGSSLQFSDGAVMDTQRGSADAAGAGLVSSEGAALTLERTTIDGGNGGVSIDEGATGSIRDVAVRGTHPFDDGRFGRGVNLQHDAVVTARHLLVFDAAEAGIIAGVNSQVTVEDAIVQRIAPSGRGFGVGLLAYNTTTANFARLAVDSVAGTGVSAASLDAVTHSFDPASQLAGQDLFIRAVGSSTIGITGTDPEHLQVMGAAVAYGLHAGHGCSATVTHAVYDSAGYGVFAGPMSTVTLHDALVARQLDAAIVRRSGATLVTDGIHFVDNARNDIVQDDSLPESASLPPPTAICPVGGCP